MNRTVDKHAKGRSQRWEQGLVELAKERGDTEAIGLRAVGLVKALNVAPWLALAVAERKISLKDAELLDRAARCKELQVAVLDKRMTVAQLRVAMPYAPYLLVADLVPVLPQGGLSEREMTQIFKVILGAERCLSEDGDASPVRIKPTAEYISLIKRMQALLRETRCGLPMALDVAMGRTTEVFVREYAAHRGLLDREQKARLMEERAQMMELRYGRRPYPSQGRFPTDRPRRPGDYDRPQGERYMRPMRREQGRDSRARTSGS